jgi:hypothetical protein
MQLLHNRHFPTHHHRISMDSPPRLHQKQTRYKTARPSHKHQSKIQPPTRSRRLRRVATLPPHLHHPTNLPRQPLRRRHHHHHRRRLFWFLRAKRSVSPAWSTSDRAYQRTVVSDLNLECGSQSRHQETIDLGVNSETRQAFPCKASPQPSRHFSKGRICSHNQCTRSHVFWHSPST